jgi:glycosyltransferase involved in cell wall biosynthesis
MGIGNAVEFCLDVTSQELRNKLQTLDVFVVPWYQEGQCISALEAMACSFRVVPKRCGGHAVPIESGETEMAPG